MFAILSSSIHGLSWLCGLVILLVGGAIEGVSRRWWPHISTRRFGHAALVGIFMLVMSAATSLIMQFTLQKDEYLNKSLVFDAVMLTLGILILATLLSRRSRKITYPLHSFRWFPSVLLSTWGAYFFAASLALYAQIIAQDSMLYTFNDSPSWFEVGIRISVAGFVFLLFVIAVVEAHKALRQGRAYNSPLGDAMLLLIFSALFSALKQELYFHLGNIYFLSSMFVHELLLLRRVDWDSYLTYDAAVEAGDPLLMFREQVVPPMQETAT